MPYLRNKTTDQPGGDDEQQQAPGGGGPSSSPSRLMSGYGATPTATTVGTLSPSYSMQPGAQQSAQSGLNSSATGYVNFDRFFNANQGAAKTQANNLNNQVVGAGKAAESDLGNTVSSFNKAAQAGSVAAPNQEQQDWSQYADDDVQHPKVVTGTQLQNQNATPSNSNPEAQTQTQEGITSQPTRGGTSSSGNIVTPTAPYDQGQAAYDANAVAMGATGSYTGPSTLDTMAGYGDAETAKTSAEDQLAGLQTTGGIQGLLQADGNAGGYSQNQSAFDAALDQRAGQPDFNNTQSEYGNLDSLFNTAQTNAQNTAAADTTSSAANAGAYQGLMDSYTQRQAADQGQVDAGQANQGANSIAPGGSINASNPQVFSQMAKDFGLPLNPDGTPTAEAMAQLNAANVGNTSVGGYGTVNDLGDMTEAERQAWWAKHKNDGGG